MLLIAGVLGIVAGLLAGGRISNVLSVQVRYGLLIILALLLRLATLWLLDEDVAIVDQLRVPLFATSFGLLVLTYEYRMHRIFGFKDPWTDPFGRGSQLSLSRIAFGRGEFLGVGLGASVEKLFYLPEAHTDFLLAVIAEELGFLGVAAVIALFAWIVMRAFAIGRQAALRDRHFAALAAQGIGVWLGFQALINMGVNMGLLPTKGLTLPLISYGRSSLIVAMMTLGMLLRIHHELVVDASQPNRRRRRKPAAARSKRK